MLIDLYICKKNKNELILLKDFNCRKMFLQSFFFTVIFLRLHHHNAEITSHKR